MDAEARRLGGKQNFVNCLAGLEAGTVGILWMLVWLGLSSAWQQRSFWTPENLMATAFDRNSTLAPVFSWATCGGVALYVLIYSVLGAVFASAVRERVTPGRVMLLAVAGALAWYYFSFRWLFKLVLPLVALLHVERPMIIGHLLYGTLLGRYPQYARRLMPAAAAEPETSPSGAPAAEPSGVPPAAP